MLETVLVCHAGEHARHRDWTGCVYGLGLDGKKDIAAGGLWRKGDGQKEGRGEISAAAEATCSLGREGGTCHTLLQRDETLVGTGLGAGKTVRQLSPMVTKLKLNEVRDCEGRRPFWGPHLPRGMWIGSWSGETWVGYKS